MDGPKLSSDLHSWTIFCMDPSTHLQTRRTGGEKRTNGWRVRGRREGRKEGEEARKEVRKKGRRRGEGREEEERNG